MYSALPAKGQVRNVMGTGQGQIGNPGEALTLLRIGGPFYVTRQIYDPTVEINPHRYGR